LGVPFHVFSGSIFDPEGQWVPRARIDLVILPVYGRGPNERLGYIN